MPATTGAPDEVLRREDFDVARGVVIGSPLQRKAGGTVNLGWLGLGLEYGSGSGSGWNMVGFSVRIRFRALWELGLGFRM